MARARGRDEGMTERELDEMLGSAGRGLEAIDVFW
jgi:hypothetical protein